MPSLTQNLTHRIFRAAGDGRCAGFHGGLRWETQTYRHQSQESQVEILR